MASPGLGRTGLQPGRVGLGTVKLGRNTDVKYPEGFELPDDDAVERLLEGAWQLGVRLFDTAPAYGCSEERLAPFVRRHRAEMVLCGKAGEDYGPAGSVYGFEGWQLRASVERSLERLGTDYLDILLIHSDGHDLEILEQGDAVSTLLRCKEEGLARAVGISAKNSAGILAARDSLDVVMAPYSAAYPDLAEALRAAHAAGLGVMAIKGLGSGHLAQGDPQSVPRSLGHVFSRDFLDCLVVGTLSISHLAQAVELAAATHPPTE